MIFILLYSYKMDKTIVKLLALVLIILFWIIMFWIWLITWIGLDDDTVAMIETKYPIINYYE
jgi:phage shock protein PspC (stress-responsive transcriptional regulator)